MSQPHQQPQQPQAPQAEMAVDNPAASPASQNNNAGDHGYPPIVPNMGQDPAQAQYNAQYHQGGPYAGQWQQPAQAPAAMYHYAPGGYQQAYGVNYGASPPRQAAPSMQMPAVPYAAHPPHPQPVAASSYAPAAYPGAAGAPPAQPAAMPPVPPAAMPPLMPIPGLTWAPVPDQPLLVAHPTGCPCCGDFIRHMQAGVSDPSFRDVMTRVQEQMQARFWAYFEEHNRSREGEMREAHAQQVAELERRLKEEAARADEFRLERNEARDMHDDLQDRLDDLQRRYEESRARDHARLS
ncbi:hypothetical protein OH77DRAFT_1514961 [Trametes cingulata]|nr:hypothetical protein OH77DRAFT_1514961 [Trametes cingulata]